MALLFATAVACSSSDEEPGAQAGDPASSGSVAASDASSGSDGADAESPVEYALAQQFDLSIEVTSSEFNARRRIPRKYSCTQEDISPPIAWTEPPQGTVSLALVVDSDQFPGPPYAHWVVWGISPDNRALPEAVANTPEAPSIGPTARQGTNGDDKIGWSGPCPPPVRLNWTGPKADNNPVKRYLFKLYALDTDIELGSDATKEDLLRAIDGHILAGGELAGEHVSSQRLSGSEN
jgi:hypothetical protein